MRGPETAVFLCSVLDLKFTWTTPPCLEATSTNVSGVAGLEFSKACPFLGRILQREIDKKGNNCREATRNSGG